ncbi:MAG: hypothetical protein M3P06_23300, partial [Acidobacteriota bacterium]|nr:hypothetical protein [Acidobacteriota bacterium]
MTDESQSSIDRLIEEVTLLRQANVDLQTRVETLAVSEVRAPDELASALRFTVDRLASELATLTNPVSNFAVKDFRLETNVAVTITPFGNIEYRLLQPGANVDPSTISRLSISLVPTPKTVAGTLSPVLFEPEKGLAAIGVGDELRHVLEQNHIFTVSDFRTAINRVRVRLSILSTLATPRELATLESRAGLSLLAGIDLPIADALIAAKIDNLQALARASAEGLLLVLPEVERPLLEQWIEAARSFTGIDPAVQPQRIVGVSTDPAGLLVKIAGEEHFTTSPLMRQSPTARAVTVGTLRRQLTEAGAGYQFVGWSSGGEDATTTILSTKEITAAANFKTACYSVIASSVSLGGSITLVPPIGGVAGFPAHCFAPGSRVQFVATPEAGYGLKALTIAARRSRLTVTSLRTAHVVDEPVVARATFVPRPANHSTIFLPVAHDEGHFRSRVFFSNPTPTPGLDLRVTAVRLETTAGSGSVTLLTPLPVAFGDLPADGQSADRHLLYDIPATVMNYNVFLTVSVRNAAGDVFTSEVGIG